jgi:hypothetical protein
VWFIRRLDAEIASKIPVASIPASSQSIQQRELRTIAEQSNHHWAYALPVLVAISLFYVFIASYGTFKDLPGIQTNYYDRMCEGFRHGHLHILEAPSPSLLAKPDPFHGSNIQLWLWDASLYKGKYYLYWGPVPGLLLLLFKVITRHQGEITDQWPTVLFMLGRLYAGAALLVALGSHVRQKQAPWIVALGVAIFGLANPAPWIVARPHVYEASLAAGQCFLLWGLVAAYYGIVRSDGRWRTLLLAGLAWSLAIGSRITMVIPVPLLIAITAAVVYVRVDRSKLGALGNLLAMGLPVGLTLAGYASYNYLRFESIFEFGTTYQVTVQKYVTAPQYVIPNLFSYLFAPVDWSCQFPFVTSPKFRPLPRIIDWPSDYETFEPVSGLLTSAPWCWLAGVALLRPLIRLWQWWKHPNPTTRAAVSAPELWALLAGLAILPAIMPALGMWEASMRYSGDALAGLLIAATLAAFWLLRRAEISRSPWLRVQTRSALVLLGGYTCLVGAFCAMATYNEPFKNNNPILYQRLDDMLSVCAADR